jgi:D-serine deaminase-like pyridoxal phosphate-dependent protein
MDLKKIKKPTLLLDESKCRSNINKMASKARLSGVNFRPHFKTHQSIEIGNWFREAGVNSITVSSVTMAKHFAGAGWNDITIAFPLNILEIDDAEVLAETVNLNILVSDINQAGFLRERSKLRAGYFIKIDTGYGRCGFEWNDHRQIMRILETMDYNSSLRFKGFLTHAGHTYKAVSKKEIIDIYDDTLIKCTSLRELLPDKIMLSSGDTPSCSLIDDFNGFDEIRPGNFVFYDLMQYFLGSCNFEEIALLVACPVVEKNLKRREIIIYGGGVHLSKECIKASDGKQVFGKALLPCDNGWINVSDSDLVRSVSQEHGIISCSEGFMKRVNAGDIVGIIPVHSCMTADLLRQYNTFDGRTFSDFSPK